MDSFLAAELHYSDGRVLRFGPDESTPGDVPRDIQFSTQIPGGFGNGSIVLPRPANLRADDAMLFSWVRLYGPGSRTAYEGRVVGVPQVGPSEVRLELEGFVADLEHDKTFRDIYVHSDMNPWGPASTQRQINMIAATFQPVAPTVVPDAATGEPSLDCLITGAWHGSFLPLSEAWFDARGIPLDSVYFAAKGAGNYAAANFHAYVRLATDDIANGLVSSSDLIIVGLPTTGTLDADRADQTYVIAHYYYGAGAAGADNEQFHVFWTCLAPYGTHGLTKRGTATATEPQGFYPHDVIANVVSRTAPALNYTVGDSIDEVELSLIHLAFLDPTTGRAVIEHVTLLGSSPYLHDWGVYENQEFFWKPPGSYGRTWRVRKDQFATPTSDGPDSSTRMNGLMLTYRDGAGKAHTVGPTGSGADYETDDLLDTDLENPAQRVGRKWDHQDIGINSQAGAVFVGQMLLAEANRINWRGKVKITGEVRDEAGNVYPAWLVRGGDHVVVEDADDLTPRYINSTDYVDAGMELTANIGAWPHSSEVLMGQLAAAADLAGAR